MDKFNMSPTETVVGVVIAVVFVVMILYVLFGQITVRKLRKNPETKNELGMEFVSGWDIINVAQSLAIPVFIMRRLRNTPLSFLYANTELLIKHTNKFDRVLAFLFYWLMMASGLFMATWALLDVTGVFN
jgi:hypothetical protein